MKKLLSYISIFSMMVMLLWSPSIEVYAANLSVSASASSVKIGDTVTVTVSVPSDITATVAVTFPTDILSFSSATGTTSTNGGTVTTTLGDPFSTSCTLTFTAKTSGTATVSASSVKAGNSSTGEVVELGGGSASITVANESSSGGGNSGGGTSETEKSADNFLASLKLSSGTLSPSFYYATTSYTATVGYDVTSVVVTATTSSAKATIDSVTGNGTVALSVGENKIELVVTAENGVKRTYTVVVTRLAEGESTGTETETDTETETEIPGDITTDILQWQGETLTTIDEIPEEVIPQGFTVSEAVVNGEAIPALSFANGDLQVLYLMNSNGAGSLYVYDDLQQCIYPFIKIQSENSYVMVLLPNVELAPAPEGYQECTLSLEGKGIITAYQYVQTTQDGTSQEGTTEGDTTTDTTTTSWNSFFDFGPETFYAAEPVISDFYLIYCMNESGETGWYMYDAVEGTFQRYFSGLHAGNGVAGGVTDATLQAQNLQLATQLKDTQNLMRIIICVAIFVAAVMIIIIINLLLKRRMDEELEDDEFDEEDDFEFIDDEDIIDDEEEVIDDVEIEEEDDEFEIEFYEIPEVTVEDEVEEEEDDDELEIEFYEIPEVSVEDEVEEEDDELEIEFYEIPEVTVEDEVLLDEKTEDEKKKESVEKKEPNREEKLDELERLLASRTVEDDGDDLEFIELD